MTVESLKKALQTTPFVPFTLQLGSGEGVRVPSPEFVLVPPNSPRTIVVAEDGGFRIIDLLLVEELRTGRVQRKKAG